jgi:hypothetical protein
VRCGAVSERNNGASAGLTLLTCDSLQIMNGRRFQRMIRDVILPLGNKLNEAQKKVREPAAVRRVVSRTPTATLCAAGYCRGLQALKPGEARAAEGQQQHHASGLRLRSPVRFRQPGAVRMHEWRGNG